MTVRRHEVAILIPVLNRPQRVPSLLKSIRDSAYNTPLKPVWLTSPNDRAERRALFDAGESWLTMEWEPGPGDYARKMNYGLEFARSAGHRYAFLAADDLAFRPGWVEYALAKQVETFACVVGTNDAGNTRTAQGQHSTHSLVHLGYLECGSVDGPPGLLHEGYDHNFVDDEFVQTAVQRGAYIHAPLSVVEHLHPDWRKNATDTTYAKGKAHFADDRQLYNRRALKHGWPRR